MPTRNRRRARLSRNRNQRFYVGGEGTAAMLAGPSSLLAAYSSNSTASFPNYHPQTHHHRQTNSLSSVLSSTSTGQHPNLQQHWDRTYLAWKARERSAELPPNILPKCHGQPDLSCRTGSPAVPEYSNLPVPQVISHPLTAEDVDLERNMMEYFRGLTFLEP